MQTDAQYAAFKQNIYSKLIERLNKRVLKTHSGMIEQPQRQAGLQNPNEENKQGKQTKETRRNKEKQRKETSK